jgi:hypothetical protein
MVLSYAKAKMGDWQAETAYGEAAEDALNSDVVSYTPLLGDAVAIYQGSQMMKEGNYVGGSLMIAAGGVGIAPGGGDAAAVGLKKVAKEATEEFVETTVKRNVLAEGENAGRRLLAPGPHAGGSVAATGPRVTPGQKAELAKIGQRTGCHSCGTKDFGTKSGKPIGDHQPATGLNKAGEPQRLYPQCATCSAKQGPVVRKERKLREESK